MALLKRHLAILPAALLATLVVLGLSACGGGASGGGGSGGGGHPQQANARPLPDEEYKALPPGEYHSEEFKPAFSFRVGKGWQNPDADIKEKPERLIIESTEEVKGGTLLIFRNPPEAYDPQTHKWVNVDSYEDILSWFQHHPYLTTSKPEPVTVGGVKGVRL